MADALVWLYEDGIGEERAALVNAEGRVVEALIEPDTPRLRAGTVLDMAFAGHRDGRGVLTDGRHEAIVTRPPREWTDGQRVRVEIVREALPEHGEVKRAVARPAPDTAVAAPPTLRERIETTGLPVRGRVPFAPRLLGEDDDWNEVLGHAHGQPVAFDAGRLHVEWTRAMTVIDVDGPGDLAGLAVRAGAVAALTIRRLGLAGVIAIDFPTVDKAARLAAASAFDAALPPPFERTAINGFGLMQVVRPRVRPSLVELIRLDPAGFWARHVLAEAEGLAPGATRLVVSPAVAAALIARPDWLATLGQRLGGTIGLRADPARPNSCWYAEN